MAALIAPLLRGLAWLLKSKLGYFIAAAMAWLGINWASLEIIVQPTVDLLLAFAQGGGGTGTGDYWADAVAWMGVLNFDKALTMVISAVATKTALLNGRLFLFRRGVGA